MPSRFVSLAILIYWSIAAFCLLTGDVLPELSLGYAPDLRSIAFASDSNEPVRWSMQVIDDPKTPDVRRTIGTAVTGSTRRPDGWFALTSKVEFEAAGMLKGTPFGSGANIGMEIDSVYRVDPSGNLQSFDMQVKSQDSAGTLVKVTRQLKGATMEIVSRGPIEILNKTFSIRYEPRSVVHDALGPLDRLPGLHVGQRWETNVISPLTGRVDKVRVEVKRRDVINWDGNPVNTFEVEHQMNPISMRTWVRTDGVILRQEVPFPFVRLMLERQPDRPGVPKTPTKVPGS
jgi:hypothetical protein